MNIGEKEFKVSVVRDSLGHISNLLGKNAFPTLL